jgi:hypothetical protein
MCGRQVENRDYFSHRGVRTITKNQRAYGRHKDGTGLPVEVEVKFDSLETGGEVMVSGFIWNITASKGTEELVSHLAAMVEASDVGVFNPCEEVRDNERILHQSAPIAPGTWSRSNH